MAYGGHLYTPQKPEKEGEEVREKKPLAFLLIKGLITVTLSAADASNNNQDLAPLKFIINK